MSDRRRRIVVIAPILARHDAISTAALDSFQSLSGHGGWEVSLLTNWTDHADSPAEIIGGVAGLLKCDSFRSADALLYHFGVYHPYFDALIVGNGFGRQIVRFHNITPPELLPASAGADIRRARIQVHNLRHADRIWADSSANAEVLIDSGIAAEAIDVMPLSVTAPTLARFVDKPGPPVEILFVGRIVKSKGVLDLIDAIVATRRATDTPFRLRIVGNLGFSDASYVEAVKSAIRQHRLERVVEFLGTIGDHELERLYHRAHIFALPSYHEGFCKPVIEALRAGCVPLTYSAYSLRTIAAGLSRTVAAGDVEGFATALGGLVESVVAALDDGEGPCFALERGLLSARQFDDAARHHVARFSLEALAPQWVHAIGEVMTRPGRAMRRP